MTDGYDCYQNALAERVNGILKHEFLLQLPKDLDQARRMVSQSVSIYNTQRPHGSLQLTTPHEVHRASLQVSHWAGLAATTDVNVIQDGSRCSPAKGQISKTSSKNG